MMGWWQSLSTADKINLLIAIGTLIAAIAAALSAWLAARAIRETARQVDLQSAEFRAQTFLSVLSYEREVDFSSHMEVVRNLDASHPQFNAVEERSILVVVNFINHLAHLIRYRYLDPKQLMRLYTPSIESCREKLIGTGKWLNRKREQSPKFYLHFGILCDPESRALIWSGKARQIEWPDPDPDERSLYPEKR